MKLDLPEWSNDQQIYVIAGQELVAFRDVLNGEWYVKYSRCIRCGRCCMVHPNDSYQPLALDGACSRLKKDGDIYFCSLGIERPFPCIIGEPVGKEHRKFNCSIFYKLVGGNNR